MAAGLVAVAEGEFGQQRPGLGLGLVQHQAQGGGVVQDDVAADEDGTGRVGPDRGAAEGDVGVAPEGCDAEGAQGAGGIGDAVDAEKIVHRCFLIGACPTGLVPRG